MKGEDKEEDRDKDEGEEKEEKKMTTREENKKRESRGGGEGEEVNIMLHFVTCVYCRVSFIYCITPLGVVVKI